MGGKITKKGAKGQGGLDEIISYGTHSTASFGISVDRSKNSKNQQTLGVSKDSTWDSQSQNMGDDKPRSLPLLQRLRVIRATHSTRHATSTIDVEPPKEVVLKGHTNISAGLASDTTFSEVGVDGIFSVTHSEKPAARRFTFDGVVPSMSSCDSGDDEQAVGNVVPVPTEETKEYSIEFSASQHFQMCQHEILPEEVEDRVVFSPTALECHNVESEEALEPSPKAQQTETTFSSWLTFGFGF
eukprot:Nitzschia sp. Nitz4//scaffold394_size11837//5290//6015//NITZ4_009026-RA/size11837-processed-gene-0.4-mRNA-1//-1//CDS//3329550236//8799//frame0